MCQDHIRVHVEYTVHSNSYFSHATCPGAKEANFITISNVGNK